MKDRRLHPMDCMDIVVGTVHRDGRSRVGDYYTRDRSTPQPDSFYGGEDDLSGAEGWVSDGNTHIMFRKKARDGGFIIGQVYLIFIRIWAGFLRI